MKLVKEKNGKIVITASKYPNFKCRLPIRYLEYIGLKKHEKINIKYDHKKNILIIKKAAEKGFKDLSAKERYLQIKKYEKCNAKKYETKKSLMNDIGEYFSITYRTIYRICNEISEEDISEEEINDTKLMKKQCAEERNIGVIISNVPVISIPTNIAISFLESKSSEQLNLKSSVDKYQEYKAIDIKLKLFDNKEIIITKEDN